ncbi:MAG: class A beta-lactamase-related serine hydrolase [Chitinophagaceae bacterium]|nr:class A beta-lactamase-related serine hydrolase [Chitinophagaceae bacterium]
MTQPLLTGPVSPGRFPNSALLDSLLRAQQPLLQPVLADPDKYRLQIIYTQIDRDRKNRPSFQHHFFNVGQHYHYPASTVKLPAAVLALEYLNDLKILPATPMLTLPVRPGEQPVRKDPSSENGFPSVEHYIKKILLVSDNDAYNRLYELLGQAYFNSRLHSLGFSDAQIIHRLEIALSETENRQTNPVIFLNEKGDTIYRQAAQQSAMAYAQRSDAIGKGYMRQGQLVNEPLNFSGKNRWPLPYIHQLLQWIMFPESQPRQQTLNLRKADYQLLWRYMSMLPAESKWPSYDGKEYWPSYVKFLHLGSEKSAGLPPGMRIFNKVGDAYGFLLDGAYFADFDNGVEYMLSAALYVNEDGILNDNKYEYEEVGLPFLKQLGQIIYQYEKQRPRLRKPDLSAFRLQY